MEVTIDIDLEPMKYKGSLSFGSTCILYCRHAQIDTKWYTVYTAMLYTAGLFVYGRQILELKISPQRGNN